MKAHICSDFEIVPLVEVGQVVGQAMACQAAMYCPVSLCPLLQILQHVLALQVRRRTAGDP
jgi:hypothetical protein